jgi:putative heme iron utilization protein
LVNNPDPVRNADNEARALAADLMKTARFASLAVTHPELDTPYVTRIGFAMSEQNAPISLVSDLSLHTKSLRKKNQCALLVGEPEDRGDPLTHPRMTLITKAIFVGRETTAYQNLRKDYLETHPKSKLYIDFGDFNLVQFEIQSADLNGGFGKAYRLTPNDLLRA